MSSVVEICNRALANLNHGIRISDIDEDSNEADQCRLYYDASRRAALRAFPWNFAMAYEALAELSDDPVSSQWSVMYGYPSGCLAVRAILPQPAGSTPNKFEVALNATKTARVIMCDVADATARFTYDIEDPTLFDPQFEDALAWMLASQMANVLTGSVQMKQMAETQFRNVINSAWVSDGSEGVQEPVPEAEWVRARFDGGNDGFAEVS